MHTTLSCDLGQRYSGRERLRLNSIDSQLNERWIAFSQILSRQ
jgi:hypothetical protein